MEQEPERLGDDEARHEEALEDPKVVQRAVLAKHEEQQAHVEVRSGQLGGEPYDLDVEVDVRVVPGRLARRAVLPVRPFIGTLAVVVALERVKHVRPGHDAVLGLVDVLVQPDVVHEGVGNAPADDHVEDAVGEGEREEVPRLVRAQLARRARHAHDDAHVGDVGVGPRREHGRGVVLGDVLLCQRKLVRVRVPPVPIRLQGGEGRRQPG